VAVSDNDDAGAGDLERRLATILSADVAAYSRLMAEDEEETLRIFRGHKEVFEKLVALHRGRIFNTAGDAILAEFGSAVEAVRCATEIQAALRTRNDQLPEGRQVQFRIGVNLGDVMVQGHDLLGDGVNVAARLQSAAAPGGICIAGSVYDQIRNRLSLSFKPLGDMKYKNIPQAVRTFSIIEAEGLGELPVPDDEPAARTGGAFPRWLAAAAVVLLLVVAGGGAFWAYSGHQRRAPDTARAKADHKATPAAASVAAAPAQPPPAALAPSENSSDGVYIGPICFAATETLPAFCFPAEATLRQGRIAGEWPGRDANTTWHLEGDVSVSGHATLRLHGQKSDGSRFAAVDFGGTLRDGTIDATGIAPNSRTATLNWRRRGDAPAATAPATPAPAVTTPVAPTPATPAPATVTPAAVETPASTAQAVRMKGSTDGVYAGPICLGQGPADGPRCFRAQATVENGRISGQWPARDPSITMHLEGEVLPTGAVTIHLHADEANGRRRANANLTGTLHDGKLDATGTFLNGRSASLNWSKN
jgi:class 3 adenylate cyclase